MASSTSSRDTPTAGQPAAAPKKEQTKLPAFKVTKPGVKRGLKKLPKALQRPLRPSGKHPPIKIAANGLVDVQDPPSYLVVAFKRNNAESPLLRLDKSIRKKIWEYAMGGHTIEVKARKVEPTEKPAPTAAASDTGSAYVGKIAHHGPKRTQPRAAFHLPEVCRAIYQETATLGYSTNQFAFVGEVWAKFGRENGPDGALEGWCRELVPAQVDAVTIIRPHWHDLQDYLDKNNKRSFKQLFPNLKQLRVPSRVVNCDAKWPCRGDPMRKHLRQQAKDRIATLIKQQEGDDVTAVFLD
ncbi:beta transducin [Didymosphaeria variabile]|uniref:Beta transducin n=1 Tax=Didymosphaeria variabile TaxID=1932322 RepID=A0A9W9C594_9PLEO|nr:beta transducin [Didymosphaeria variabile]KAJ4345871.1 beta transducin [Didymosphaeria variabile]